MAQGRVAPRREDEIFQWQLAKFVTGVIGKIFRLSFKWWVVSVPLLVWMIAALAFNDFIGLVLMIPVAYGCWKLWTKARRAQKKAYAQRAAAFGSVQDFAQAEHFAKTWPEVARHAGLTRKKELYGLSAGAAAREEMRRLDATSRLDQMHGSALEGLDIPKILALTPSPLGARLEIEMLPGQTLRTYENAAEAIGHQWGVESIRVSPAQAGVVAIVAVTKSPLANTIEITAPTVPQMTTLKHVTVGVQEDGRPWN